MSCSETREDEARRLNQEYLKWRAVMEDEVDQLRERTWFNAQIREDMQAVTREVIAGVEPDCERLGGQRLAGMIDVLRHADALFAQDWAECEEHDRRMLKEAQERLDQSEHDHRQRMRRLLDGSADQADDNEPDEPHRTEEGSR